MECMGNAMLKIKFHQPNCWILLKSTIFRIFLKCTYPLNSMITFPNFLPKKLNGLIQNESKNVNSRVPLDISYSNKFSALKYFFMVSRDN